MSATGAPPESGTSAIPRVEHLGCHPAFYRRSHLGFG